MEIYEQVCIKELMGDMEEIEKLKRKVLRRDAKLEKKTARVVSLKATVGTLEKDLKSERVAHAETKSNLAVAKELSDMQSKTIAALKAQAQSSDKAVAGKTLESRYGKGRPKVSRWCNYHPVNGGKRVPSTDNAMQAERFRTLDIANKGVELRKGELLMLLPGASCYGYREEAGSNIIIHRSTKLPLNVTQALMDDVNSVVPDKSTFSRMEVHADRVFDELATRSTYALFEDLQGPVYLNGQKPVFKSGWSKDDQYDCATIISMQPDLIGVILRSALDVSQLNLFAKETQKQALLATLNKLYANHSKMGFTTQSYKGRLPRKFTLPEDICASKDVRQRNLLLPKTPPLVGDLVVPPPRIGEMGKLPKASPHVGRKSTSPVKPRENGPQDLLPAKPKELSRTVAQKELPRGLLEELSLPGKRKKDKSSKRGAMESGRDEEVKKKKKEDATNVVDTGELHNNAFSEGVKKSRRSEAMSEALSILKEMSKEDAKEFI